MCAYIYILCMLEPKVKMIYIWQEHKKRKKTKQNKEFFFILNVERQHKAYSENNRCRSKVSGFVAVLLGNRKNSWTRSICCLVTVLDLFGHYYYGSIVCCRFAEFDIKPIDYIYIIRISIISSIEQSTTATTTTTTKILI